MRFGLQLNPYVTGPSGDLWATVAAVARLLDATAWDSLFLYDHFMWDKYPGQPDGGPAFDCFVALGAIAAITRRLRLGQLVLGVPYRNPAHVAKMATTLDVISGGRSILGLGSAWYEREFRAYGWDFEPRGVRMQRLVEAVRVIVAMWTERPASFNGRYYRLDRAFNDPPPVQQPHPPILIGGNGEKVTLRLVGRYGQWSNLSGPPDEVERLHGVIRDFCREFGRRFDEITNSVFLRVVIAPTEAAASEKLARLKARFPGFEAAAGPPDFWIERLRAYARVGSQYATIQMHDAADLEPLSLFAETVIPALRDE